MESRRGGGRFADALHVLQAKVLAEVGHGVIGRRFVAPSVERVGENAGFLQYSKNQADGGSVGDGLVSSGCKALAGVDTLPEGLDIVVGGPGSAEGLPVAIKVYIGDSAVGVLEVLEQLQGGDETVPKVGVLKGANVGGIDGLENLALQRSSNLGVGAELLRSKIVLPVGLSDLWASGTSRMDW